MFILGLNKLKTNDIPSHYWNFEISVAYKNTAHKSPDESWVHKQIVL